MFAALSIVADCTVDPASEPATGPMPGDTWVIEAVDRAGVFGDITITRGEYIEATPQDLEGHIFLLYQPLLGNAGSRPENRE